MSWIDSVRFDERGLVPVVVQSASSGEVLMFAFANREALESTVRTGSAHYWSRSRSSLWRKGETSGHVQHVVEVRVDCDEDVVLYRVDQVGPACHTLERSCFHRRVEGEALVPAPGAGHILSTIEDVVAEREESRPEGSYTTYLFEQGLDKILKKVGEETTEAIVAAKNADGAALTSETADLLFHLLVLLRERGVPLDDVWRELAGRFGQAPRDLERLARDRTPDLSA